jgi:NAD(P)-dependent dehydrogenase (short-subunit alcohol dehydrogenase family)
MAARFAADGAKVVLADVEEAALAVAAKELEAEGAEVAGIVCDVAKLSSVEALADAATSRFGAVHVLCNNAGVAGGLGGSIWEASAKDWDWVVGVNLMGVVHGIQAFVPRMLDHGEDGHVVNTSSVLGLSSGGGSIYSVTKHAVTRLSEGLFHDLRAVGSRIGVSVLCPGLIATHIVSSDRNRPAHLRDDMDEVARAQASQHQELAQGYFLSEGMPPSEVADMVAEAIRVDRFYVLTHPDMIKPQVEERLRAVLDEADPPAGFSMG